MAEENKLLNDPYFSTEATVEAPQERAVEARPAVTERANPLLSDPYFQPEASKRPASTTTATAPTPVSPTRRTTHASPTLYHQAPIKQPGEKDLTVGETLSGAAKNFIPSALGVVGAFTHALTHPAETLGAVGDIGTGLLSKAAGAAGAQQDHAKKKQEEQVVNALFDHYKKTYFTSSQDFMRAFKKDPASIFLDFSTLTGIGAAGLPGKFGQAAKIAATVTDPIQSSLAIARGVGSLPAKGLRVLQATSSEVPYATLTDIYNLARKGDPVLKEGVQLGRTLPETEITRKVVDALDTAADAASVEYLASKAGQPHANKKPPVNDVLQTIQKAEDDLTIAGTKPHAPYTDPVTGNRVEHPYWDAYQELQNLRNQVKAYDANPAYNVLEADKFKRSLYERRNQVQGRAQNSVDQVSKAVRKSISDVSPEYATIMDKWQTWIQTAKGIKQGGANANLSPAASMTRLLNSMKTDLKRKNVIDVLAKHDQQLPYILAGYATKPIHKGNISLMDAVLSGAGWYALSHPLGAVGSLGLASPRLSSMSQTALGKIGKYGAAATSRPVTAGAYYGERALQEEGQQPDQISSSLQPGSFFSRILGAESSTGQYKNGNTVISPKGAVGAAQVMPGTGPEAAALAGEEWSLDRLHNDEGYNKRLGEAYLNKLLQDYGGDERKAAAAYNAGPGGLQRAMARAETEGGTWEDYVPDETKGYIAKIFRAAGGRIGRASGGRITNHRSEADSLIRLADKTKKALNNSTESLLAVPDEAVTKALSIANEAI
jgi:hypothetical protein